jgi:Kef-type K+ transport system membrane component KefB/voltage-gated potassium channel Kch
MDMSILILLAVALGLIILMKKADAGPSIAFLFAGAAAGPYALGLYQVSGAWTILGEMGMMFLWFMLGLELNTKRLWTMRKTIFGLGAAQVLVVVALLFPLIFGFAPWPMMGAFAVALMLTMSSTGMDLQLLADRNELQSKLGRQAFSIILFQDLLSIPILAMLPVFAAGPFNLGAEIIDVSILTICLVAFVMVAARLVMNPVMRLIAKLRSREAFLLVFMLNIAAWAVVFHYAGLPLTIGAFLAGMLYSETIYNHQVRADIAPYQMVFMSLFFITLGMGLNLPYLSENIWLILAGAAGLVLVKFIAIYVVARLRKAGGRNAFMLALILAQGGEFGLLVLQTLKMENIEAIPFPHTEILTAIIIVSMIMTPLLLRAYEKLYESGALYSLRKAKKYNADPIVMKPAAIICGFGRVGMTIAKMLASKNIPYVAIDMNVDQVVRGREAGFGVFYGDTTRSDVLAGFGLAPRTTRVVIVALDNAAVAKRTVRAAKRVAPSVRIFARARNLSESKELVEEGARVALPETIESSFLLGRGVLEDFGVGEKDIQAVMSRLRRDNYEMIDRVS